MEFKTLCQIKKLIKIKFSFPIPVCHLPVVILLFMNVPSTYYLLFSYNRALPRPFMITIYNINTGLTVIMLLSDRMR